jgi:hypothetical protein
MTERGKWPTLRLAKNSGRPILGTSLYLRQGLETANPRRRASAVSPPQVVADN